MGCFWWFHAKILTYNLERFLKKKLYLCSIMFMFLCTIYPKGFSLPEVNNLTLKNVGIIKHFHHLLEKKQDIYYDSQTIPNLVCVFNTFKQNTN